MLEEKRLSSRFDMLYSNLLNKNNLNDFAILHRLDKVSEPRKYEKESYRVDFCHVGSARMELRRLLRPVGGGGV